MHQRLGFPHAEHGCCVPRHNCSYCCCTITNQKPSAKLTKNKKKQEGRPHLSHVEHEGSKRLPVRGVHVRVGLVGDELVVHHGRSHALGPVTPAEHF